MKRFLFLLINIVVLIPVSFGAVKFKGDLITIGDFKYMQSNYVYNNVPTDSYLGLDNVEFIVNFRVLLELTSDIYGIANVIVQPTTKFKHATIDSLMINYLQKASKVKIVPFYRYRVARFYDPENSIKYFNSWVISSSVFGVGNITNSKVDNDGFYVDSSSLAEAGGIPYILRPVEFMDGTIVAMPGMAEDTTNLSLVGRDLGGFYAEQRAKGYMWQIFLGSYFIDGSEGALNLSGGANVRLDVFEIEDIAQISLGLIGDFYRFSGASLNNFEIMNAYIYTIPNMRSFAALYNYGGYIECDTDYFNLYVKFTLNSQGQLLNNMTFNEALKGDGYRISGGVFSDIIEGSLIQLGGSYSSYRLFTNTNISVKPEAASRIDFFSKVSGSYELLFGGYFNFVGEFTYFMEDLLNRYNVFPYFNVSSTYFINGGMIGKIGIGVYDLLNFIGVSVLGAYESIYFNPVVNNVVDKNKIGNITRISSRANLGIEVVEGFTINLGGAIFMWSDDLTSKGFVPGTVKKDLNLMYYAISPNVVYKPSDYVLVRVGYGYPILGDTYDIDYGIISDSLEMNFYKNQNNLFEGIYGWYVLQNLPRIYVDLKISF
ncbi:MAG: hypothetical protein N2712_06925 [Brevinematales bacterium]|nr:hypothetical protein [Brevinematales bacterium]